MRISAALLLLFLLLFPRARAASTPAAVTRGEFVVLLWESAGAVPGDAAQGFSDVLKDDNCSTAIGWAAERRLVLGTGGGRFEPDRPITREEVARGGTPFSPTAWLNVTITSTSPPGRTTPSTGPQIPACWSGPRADDWTPAAP